MELFPKPPSITPPDEKEKWPAGFVTEDQLKGFVTEDQLNTHLADNMPHRATDPSTEKVYRWGLAVQNGEWGILYEEVV